MENLGLMTAAQAAKRFPWLVEIGITSAGTWLSLTLFVENELRGFNVATMKEKLESMKSGPVLIINTTVNIHGIYSSTTSVEDPRKRKK